MMNWEQIAEILKLTSSNLAWKAILLKVHHYFFYDQWSCQLSCNALSFTSEKCNKFNMIYTAQNENGSMGSHRSESWRLRQNVTWISLLNQFGVSLIDATRFVWIFYAEIYGYRIEVSNPIFLIVLSLRVVAHANIYISAQSLLR